MRKTEKLKIMFDRKDGTACRLHVGGLHTGVVAAVPLAVTLKPPCVSGDSRVAAPLPEPRGQFLLHATKNPD